MPSRWASSPHSFAFPDGEGSQINRDKNATPKKIAVAIAMWKNSCRNVCMGLSSNSKRVSNR